MPDTSPVTFSTALGTFVGRHDPDAGVDRATGIRYARADRWAPPEPWGPHTGSVDATRWSPACPQPDDVLPPGMVTDPMRGLEFDEHCQALSVTVPTGTRAGADLPVLVWVHGGAHLVGAGDSPLYDPAALVREQGVVVVNVTYRIGALGFMGGGERPANLGLLDVVEAFRWVREHIAGFGGDPGRVTAIGESAGADVVAHLMIADGAEGLFARAVLMSAPLGLSRGRDGVVEGVARRAAGLDLSGDADEIARRYRSLALGGARHGLVATMPFSIQYGRHPMPAEDDTDRAWRQAARRVDVLIGSNTREVALFLPHLGPLGWLPRVPLVGRRVYEGVVESFTRRIYRDDALAFAQRHVAAGGRAWHYELATGAPGHAYAGAHATDIPLLFPNRAVWEDSPMLGGLPWPVVEQRGARLRALVAELARTGRVNPALAPLGMRLDPVGSGA